MAKGSRRGLSPAAEIEGHFKARILTGVLRVGQKLPTAEELARQFSVDPNTARAAYGRLTKAGLVRSIRGKGTFVTAEVTRGHATRLSSLVDAAISECHKLGLSPEDLATILWVHERFSESRPRIWYIDNWHPYFDRVAEQIEDAVGGPIQTSRLEEKSEIVGASPGPSDGEMVVTTKFNLERLQSTFSSIDLSYRAVAPRMTDETITSLSALPEETRLGVICIEPIFADISGKVIAKSGIVLDQIRGNTSDVASLPEVFVEADALTISTVALARLEAAHIRLPEKPIIPFAYELTDESMRDLARSASAAGAQATGA